MAEPSPVWVFNVWFKQTKKIGLFPPIGCLARLGWTFNKNVRTELGYMNQYLDSVSATTGQTSLTMHYLAMASVFVNF